MKNIYCISGLGADHRLFGNLRIEGYRLVPVPWVPFTAGDDMASYAAKMYRSIPENRPVILGVSFGGMLAVEMANAMPVASAIIVSSAKTRRELGYRNPLFLAASKWDIIPSAFFTAPFSFKISMLGAQTPPEKELLRQILLDSDPAFMKWAVRALLSWDNKIQPPHVLHIHGTADRVITPDRVVPHHWIKGGQHIMIYTRAVEIARLIAEHLRRYS